MKQLGYREVQQLSQREGEVYLPSTVQSYVYCPKLAPGKQYIFTALCGRAQQY